MHPPGDTCASRSSDRLLDFWRSPRYHVPNHRDTSLHELGVVVNSHDDGSVRPDPYFGSHHILSFLSSMKARIAARTNSDQSFQPSFSTSRSDSLMSPSESRTDFRCIRSRRAVIGRVYDTVGI